MKTDGKTSIDRLGRIVAPKALREQEGMQIVSRGRLRVAVPSETAPELSEETVKQTRDQFREHRE